MTKIAILILAAGASSRMGKQDKLLLDAQGTPLLTRVLQRAMATGHPCFVTLPDLSHARAHLVKECGAIPVPVPDWATGMSASVRKGVAALPEHIKAVMILPGDMPDLQTKDLSALVHAAQADPKSIIRATTPDGTPGHPVIFPSDLFAELLKISGDQGARQVIAAHAQRLKPCALPGDRAVCDLDTPADWIRWKTAQAIEKGR